MSPIMVRDYRCGCGHAWLATLGEPCPACGLTVAVADDPTPVDHQKSDPTFVLEPVTDPSFTSLNGDVKTDPDPYAVTRDVFSTSEEPEGAPGATHEFAAQLVPGYEIHEELGRGGMGVVYRALQTALNRPVALKMILAGSHAGPTERERFRREAQAVASLQHPNIVQIFEIGEATGHPYLALELVEGGSLAQHLVGNPWSARDAAELVVLLAQAVHYAHSQGVVHRDLKPGNILLAKESKLPSAFHSTRNAIPKVTDFGLAKRIDETVAPDGATKTGAVMGTPSYIAPEQASGKTREIGPPVDVYALGAILYELLTGRPPFRGETPLDTVLQVINEDPVSPKSLQSNVPWDLQTICLKCLMKSPAKRYSSAQALADDLRRFLNGEPIQARPLSSWGRGLKWAKRHPALAVFGFGTIAATIGILTVLSVAYARVREAVEDQKNEAAAAHRAREEESTQRKLAQKLADENEKAHLAAVEQANQLKRESEHNRRGAYALQISRIAAIVERDPKRAQNLLEDPARCPTDLRDFAWEYLHRLCYREDRAYRDHAKGDALECIAVSHGGTFVATAGASGEIRVWDPRTTRTYAVRTGVKGRVNDLSFSPDGGVVAAACEDGVLRLWQFPEDMFEAARRTMSALTFLTEFVKPFQLKPTMAFGSALKGAVRCASFSPDGRKLAVGYSDGRIQVLDLVGWRSSTVDEAVAGEAGALAFTREVASHRKSPIVPLAGVSAHTAAVTSIEFSPGGRYLASGSEDRSVYVLRADISDRPVPAFAAGVRSIARTSKFREAVRSVGFSADEKTLFVGLDGAAPPILCLDSELLREERRLLGHMGSVRSLTVSPDGRRLASGSADKTVRLWDLEEGRELATLTGHDEEVHGIAFAGDRQSVISVGSDGLARVWNTASRPHERGEVVSRDTQLASASHDAHGGTFIFANTNGVIAIRMADVVGGRFDPRPGALGFWPVPVNLPPGSNVVTVAAAPDGRSLFAGTEKSILFWRLIQLRPSKGRDPTSVSLPIATPVSIPVPKPIRAMLVSPDSTRLATLDEDGIRIWKTFEFPFSPEAKRSVPVPEPILKEPGIAAFAFHPNGEHLAVALDTGMRIVDLSGNAVAELPLLHGAVVTALAFDAAGTQLATASADGFIKVWRMDKNLALTHQADIAGHTGPVTTVAFTPGGRTLATGGVDRHIVLWDPVTGQERLTLTGHVDRLLRIQFSDDGKALLSIGRDGAVKRWRADPPPAPPLPRLPFFPVPPPKAKKG